MLSRQEGNTSASPRCRSSTDPSTSPVPHFGSATPRIGQHGKARSRTTVHTYIVDNRVPRRVAIAAFHNHVLAEDAFEGVAISECSPTRGGIVCVTFPLQAAIAFGELRASDEESNVALHLCTGDTHSFVGKQVPSFRCRSGTLELWSVHNVPDFDDSVGRVDAEQGEPS